MWYKITMKGHTVRELEAKNEQNAQRILRKEMNVEKLPDYTRVIRITYNDVLKDNP